MKRGILYSIAILFGATSFSAHAAGNLVKLRIPLQFEKTDKHQPTVCEVNLKLKKIGKEPLPQYMEITNLGIVGPYAQVDIVDGQIEAAAKALKMDLTRQGELTPGENDTKVLKTCYEGDPKGVLALVQALGDKVYSDQFTPFGYKYKKTTVYVNDSVDNKELEKLLSENSKAWKEWRGKGEAVLITASVGDGGDDVQTSIITKCK